MCHIDSDSSKSKLRILRVGSVHYPVLALFLSRYNKARAGSSAIEKIDSALCSDDFKQLMLLTEADNFEEILKTESEMSYHMSKQETCLATA